MAKSKFSDTDAQTCCCRRWQFRGVRCLSLAASELRLNELISQAISMRYWYCCLIALYLFIYYFFFFFSILYIYIDGCKYEYKRGLFSDASCRSIPLKTSVHSYLHFFTFLPFYFYSLASLTGQMTIASTQQKHVNSTQTSCTAM